MNKVLIYLIFFLAGYLIYNLISNINTFSIGDKDSSDLPYARIVSEFLGTKYN